MTTTYRTCPRSGLQFEDQAENLMMVNAVTAVVALLVGGLLAIGIVLTRWPAVHWLAADTFCSSLFLFIHFITLSPSNTQNSMGFVCIDVGRRRDEQCRRF